MSNCTRSTNQSINQSINPLSSPFIKYARKGLSGFLWGILMMILTLPALGSIGRWQENEAFRDGQTRVWESVKVQEVKNPFTGEISVNTVTHQYYEKADGLNYNAGTKDKPKWLPSVETISPTDDPYFPYQANQGPYQVRFGASINQTTPIEYTVGKETLRLGLKYMAYYDKKKGTLKPFKTLNHVNPVVDGNKVIYRDAFSGIDVEYVYQKGVFQQNIKINSKGILGNPETYGISTDNAYLVAVTEIDTTDFSTEFVNTKGDKMAQGLLKGEGCDILFKKKGNLLCTLAPSLAYADTENGKKEINQYRHIYQEGNKQYLLEGVTYQELQNLKAPLTLDYEIKSGGISSNVVWKEGKTYYISGELTVNSGATLVIEPGTICKYSTGISLNAGAGGRIIAQGDKYNYILMTSWKDNTMGESVSSSAGDPASGDYGFAIRLSTGSSSGSIIEYCKIRYAVYGLFDYDTNLTHPIQNNIMRDMYGAITLVGVSTCTVQNNLIDNCGFTGIYASSNSGYLSNAILVARNNTINNCAENGVRIEFNRFEDFSNNLITSCGTAMRVINYTFGNHSYNSFYGNNANYVGTSGGTEETTLPSTPYLSSPNGSFYLDTSKSGCIDNGSTTARVLGLGNKVTQVPVSVTADISTDQSWDKIPRDTGLVDRGYHYDPVDVVVGSTNHPIVNIYNANTTANLKIYPGVVVSFWRNLSQNTSRLWLKNGKFVAHGHADDRIQFRNIYETGDMPTYSLGSGDSYGYSYGIEFGSGVEPESYAQFCEFHHACSGILLDPGINKPIYRRFSDNIFNGCQYGMTAIDAYLRAENNLFISSPKSDYQIYNLSTSSACDTAIVRNNTFIGDQSGDRGVYGYQGASSNDYVDIRNNIYTGFKEAAIKLDTIYYTGKISNNCYFNNSTNNIVSSISVESAVYKTPQFAWSTASSVYWNGYYLAQTTGDVSRTPLKGSFLDSTNGITVNLTNAPYYWAIMAYTNLEAGGAYPLGCYTGPSGYADDSWQWSEYVSNPTGYISISIINAASPWTIHDGDYITLNFQNGSHLKVFLPTATFPSCGTPWDDSNNYLNLWVAEDGSAYYTYSGHTVTSSSMTNQDAWYVMSYDTAGLAKDSFSCLGISTCVNSGDTTVRAYGSTASSYSKDSGKIDIGYHPKNPGYIMVAPNSRLFVYEDGTPCLPMGFCSQRSLFEYQNSNTLPYVDSYLDWMKAHGYSSYAFGFHDNPCRTYGYPYNDKSGYSVETTTPNGSHLFIEDIAVWMDQFLDRMDTRDLTYYMALWEVPKDPIYYTSDTNRAIFNFWNKNSSLYYGPVTTSMEVISTETAFNVQTNDMRYYIDRWGDREGLIFWDPLPELNYRDGGGFSRDSIESLQSHWIGKMCDYIKEYSLKKWGHSHLVTVSSGRANPVIEDCSTETQTDAKVKISPLMSKILGGSQEAVVSAVGMDSSLTATYFFDHPEMDITTIHPLLVTQSIKTTYSPYAVLTTADLPDAFPLWGLATVGGDNSLWYDKTSSQWMIDSTAITVTLSLNSSIRFGFSLMSNPRPYVNGLMGPGCYEEPWSKDTFLRHETEQDNNQNRYASTTCFLDRHIDLNLHEAYTRAVAWTTMASGAAAFYHYGMAVFNPWASGVNNICYVTNTAGDGDYYQNYIPAEKQTPPREFNQISDGMYEDQTGLYKVMTCIRWKEITQWENLQDSPRLTLSGDTGYGIHAIYSGDSSHLLIWLLNELRPLPKDNYTVTNHAPSLVISGFPYGSYKVSWYSPETGELIGSPGTFTGTSISLTCPSFSRDIAAIIQGEE